MSIRPVDMQVVIHKTQEIHQAKQTVVSKMDNELAKIQDKSRRDDIRKTQTVNEMEQAEFRRVTDEDENEHESRRRRYQQSNSKKEEEISEKDKELNKKVNVAGGRFDMRV